MEKLYAYLGNGEKQRTLHVNKIGSAQKFDKYIEWNGDTDGMGYPKEGDDLVIGCYIPSKDAFSVQLENAAGTRRMASDGMRDEYIEVMKGLL